MYVVFLGPTVQNIVSLTNLLMTNSLTFVAKVFSDILIFLLQKRYSHFFSKKKKYQYIFAIFQDRNFKITLANNFVKF